MGFNGIILTSTDGEVWTARKSGTASDLHGVAYGNNMFVAVGYSGTILRSKDGILWESIGGGIPSHLR